MHSLSRIAGAICAVAVSSVNIFAAESAELNCGARVECTKPGDGLVKGLAIGSDDSIRCPLNEGETTFVVVLPNSRAVERLKFVNENAAAQGTMKIAVSNQALTADSARWTPVDGDVAFQDKRRFNVSVVGIEAKFVRVTFRVEKAARDFTFALKDFRPVKRDLFSAYFNDAAKKQTAFRDSLAVANLTPVAGLNP